jgi:hypothetical protein
MRGLGGAARQERRLEGSLALEVEVDLGVCRYDPHQLPMLCTELVKLGLGQEPAGDFPDDFPVLPTRLHRHSRRINPRRRRSRPSWGMGTSRAVMESSKADPAAQRNSTPVLRSMHPPNDLRISGRPSGPRPYEITAFCVGAYYAGLSSPGPPQPWRWIRGSGVQHAHYTFTWPSSRERRRLKGSSDYTSMKTAKPRPKGAQS